MLVVVIFLLEIVSSILAFVYRDAIEKAVHDELLEGIRKKYPKPGSSGVEEGLVDGWKLVQSSVRYRINSLFYSFIKVTTTALMLLRPN